jgi:hypothetical protein
MKQRENSGWVIRIPNSNLENVILPIIRKLMRIQRRFQLTKENLMMMMMMKKLQKMEKENSNCLITNSFCVDLNL